MRIRTVLAVALYGALTAVGGGWIAATVFQPAPAAADTYTVDNPWTYQMTDPGQQGLVILGPTTGNTQLFEAKDHLGNPIVNINAAGGMSVLGDDFRTFPEGDVFNPSNVLLKGGGIRIGVDGPTLYGTQGNPVGACTQGDWVITKTTARLYACVAGTWVKRAG